MFGSGRGKRLAAFVASILGLAFVAFALIYGLSQQQHYLQTANNAAAEYARHTTYQEKKSCRGVPAVQLSQCRADAKAEYGQKRADNRREYDDLVAQQTSALWTSIMGIAAITGMVLSVVGIFLVYTTFRETKVANVIARQSAASAAADARRSRNALIAADRAIIVVEHSKQDIPDGNWTPIGIALANEGKSNAYGFQIFYTLASEPVFKAKVRFTHNDDRICADGGTIVSRLKIRNVKNYPTYIIGFVTYSTMGDANFKSYFCFRIAGEARRDAYGHTVNGILEKVDCEGLPAMT